MLLRLTPKPCDCCHFSDAIVQKHKDNASSKAKPRDSCLFWQPILPKPKESAHSKIDCQKPEKSNTTLQTIENASFSMVFYYFEALCCFFPVFGNLFWNAYFPWVLAELASKSGNCHTVSL